MLSRYTPQILLLLVTILTGLLYLNQFGPLQDSQRAIDDLLVRFASAERESPHVQLVAIDAYSMDEFGNWPWDRDRIADLVAAIATAEPRAIVVGFELPEDAGQDSLGFTDTLAGQLRWINSAVLPYDIAVANFRSNRTGNPDLLFKNSITVDNPVGLISEEAGLAVRKVFLPATKLVQHKPLLGFVHQSYDDDRILRHSPLFMNYLGYYYPSLALLGAATYLGVNPNNIEVIDGQEIRLAEERSLPINSRGEIFINWTPETPFLTTSAADILNEVSDFEQFRDRLVFIYAEDFIDGEFYKTPVDESTPAPYIQAMIMENIVSDAMISRARSHALIDIVILFGVGILLALLMPRMLLWHRLVAVVGGLVVVANLNYFLFVKYNMMPESIYLITLLLVSGIVAPLIDSELLGGKREKKQSAVKAVSQKKPELVANIPAREIKVDPNDPASIPTGMINAKTGETTATAAGSGEIAATSAFDHQTLPGESDAPMAADDTPADPVDNQAIDPDAAGDLRQSDSGRLFTDSGSLSSDIKNLGRYEINGKLGKGAMGMVYRALDPAINRNVALKTIRLDFVNDPEEMAELKERLHREAQAAGKLSHPNIVTIYDVGSEGQLQYIAMEYLEGRTLEDMIKKKTKFNYRIIAQIISQMCAALDYAHDNGIVHRDIKPANVMILPDYTVKVMDFGIARVDSHSMTKTGIAMGTPNYISPEQLKGQATDRRADIFSLGVVMYEMLLGKRPFKGENITALIYAIINNEPEKPSNINPQVPLLFDHIISKSLQKDPQKRYQRATEVAADLADFVAAFQK